MYEGDRIPVFLVDYGIHGDCNLACSYCRPPSARRQARLAEASHLLSAYCTGLTTIADSDDALEAASLVRGEVRSGRADDLCDQVAARLDDPTRRVEVVTETHDAVALTRGDPSTIAREVHASCPVAP